MDRVSMRPLDELWENIVMEGLREGVDHDYIRNSLIDAMRKEIFDQIMFRTNVEDIDNLPQTPKNELIVSSIFGQAMKKWRSLVKRCNHWEQTLNLIKEEDLNHIWDKPEEEEEVAAEENDIPKDEEKVEYDGYVQPVEDDIQEAEIDEMTAEWPELSSDAVNHAMLEIDAYKENENKHEFKLDQSTVDAASEVMTNPYKAGDTDGDYIDEGSQKWTEEELQEVKEAVVKHSTGVSMS